MAPGTWDYVHERSIADHYDAFVADTPLCELDTKAVETFLDSVAASQLSVTADPSLVMADLGCGSGRLSMPLLNRGHHVIGVDLSHRMLEVAVAKARDAGVESRFLPLHANLVELCGLGDECVDGAICMFSTYGMIQGRANRIEFLRHVHRTLRRRGRLLLHVHSQWSTVWEPRGIRRLLRSWGRSVFMKDVEWGDAVYAYRGLSEMYLHRFSRRAVRQELREAGFGIVEMHMISLDGSRILANRSQAGLRSGGFFVTACRADSA